MAATAAAAHNPPLLTSPPPFSWAAVVSGQVAGAPLSPRSKSKSFHDVLVNNGPVKQKAPSTFRGEPAAFFSKEEISKLAAPFRYTLVGKFSYKRPKMGIIRKFFHSLDLKSLQSVGLLHENHIVIFITQEEDYTRLLMRAVWYIADAPMKILKWSPEFYPNVESPVVLVWIGLPGLPLHFFEKSALFYITSAFRTPLNVDEPTVNLTRPTVARVCIEVDVSKPRKQRLWVGDDKEGFWQEVVFENPPPYCDFCKMLGHEVSVCSRKNPSLKTETKKVHHSKDTMLEGNKTVDATQKFKENENRNETRKKKEALHSLVDNQNGNEWVVVGKKHKPKVTATQAVVVPTLAASEKERLKESEKTNERTAEQMETRDSRASVNPKKILQTAVEGNAGDRPIAVPVTVPPLLRQHLSSPCIALTPFPDLAKIKQGKGVKDGTGETSEPSFMKNKDPTGAVPIIPSVEDPQKPSLRLKLHEMGKDLQAMSSSPLPCTNKSLPLDASQVPSQPLILNVRKEQTKIQPYDQFITKIRSSDAPAMNSNPHLHSNDSVNKETDGSVSLAEDFALAAVSGIAEAIPSVSRIQPQPFDQTKREGLDVVFTAGLTEKDSEAGGLDLRVASLGSHSCQPLDHEHFKGQDLTTAPLQSEVDNGTRAAGTHAAMAEIATEKAVHPRQKKIQPLDGSIDPQTSDSAERESGPNVASGLSDLSSPYGLVASSGPSEFSKGLGNVGFEYFKGPNPSEAHSVGLKTECGLDQHIKQLGKQYSGQKIGDGLDEAGLEEGIGKHQLGSPQLAGPPITQSNFQLKHLHSGNSSPHEDRDASGSEVSDYFDYWHSDGVFLEDSEWYSDNSESAKFLKV